MELRKGCVRRGGDIGGDAHTPREHEEQMKTRISV
jgi:hypothetical protein